MDDIKVIAGARGIEVLPSGDVDHRHISMDAVAKKISDNMKP